MASLDIKKFSTSRSILRWYKGTTGSLRDVKQYKNATGAPSLQDAALRCILRNLDSLNHTHLSPLPWTMRRKLWADVKRFRLDSLRTWQMFAAAFAHEQEAFQESKYIVVSSFLSFGEILKKATAPNFEWIVNLAIDDLTIIRSEWCEIKAISNLGSLLIYNSSRGYRHPNLPSETALDDRVIKAWSIAAREEGAFSKLQVLDFLDCRRLTNDSLHFLARLPALKFCHFSRCDVDRGKSRSDWQIAEFLSKDQLVQVQELSSLSLFLDCCCPQLRTTDRTAGSMQTKTSIVPTLTLYENSTVYPTCDSKKHLWLVRTAKPQEADVSSAGEPKPKKRKLRATKEKKIGDLLGQMGG
ncbi:hypothetical protein BKA80DRAFT_345764 [Phyllosticta citrichinensis]